MDKVEHMGTASWMETRATREQQIAYIAGRRAKKACTSVREAQYTARSVTKERCVYVMSCCYVMFIVIYRLIVSYSL